MTYGITPTGFNRKRLIDIQAETTNDFQGAFGESFDLDARTPEGQIKNILDERMASLWELAEAIYQAQNPVNAEGIQFDFIAALTGITRKDASKSKVLKGRGFGTFGTKIDAGTIISVSGNNSARFLVDQDIHIDNAAVNEIQKLTFGDTPDDGTFKIVFGEDITDAVAYNETAAGVQAKLESLASIGAGNILVSGLIGPTGLTVTFQGALAGQNIEDTFSYTENNLVKSLVAVSITPSVITPGSKAFSDYVSLTAETTGPIAAPTGTLTVIETPIAGLDEFTNEEDADLGNDIEADADFKLRRTQELQLAGAGTPEAIRANLLELTGVSDALVFENDSDVTDSEGRPPHTLDIVVEGGDEDEAAEEIRVTKGTGIGTIGDIVKVLKDSQGFNKTIRFSRPTDVPIYVIVDLTTDENEFPTDGVDLVKAKILDYGNSLGLGKDVIVFGSYPDLSGSFRDVPGIIDYEIKVGKVNPPTLDNNVDILAREKADFDTSRITVNIL